MRSMTDPRRLARRALRAAIALLVVTWLVAPAAASAHPLGNFTVNRAVAIEIGAGVAVRYIVDMAEIPAFEAIRQLDTDDDGLADPDEAAVFATATCADALRGLTVTIDAEPVTLGAAGAPLVTFPAGAGGLETLRLECRYDVDDVLDPATDHRLDVRDTSDDGRIGWREVTARASGDARITDSDAPERSPSADLTAYPDDALQAPPDVRGATLSFRIGQVADMAMVPPAAAPAGRGPATDPLAALVGGELSPLVVVLALLLALGLGAIHALSPGHGKTLVAAYVLGAGGDARSAMQIGLSVAVSHTAGVFALGVVTLLASELFLPERVIGWLSLVSGVVVAGLGIVLVARQWRLLGRRATQHAHGPHGHGHGHEHPHEHGHEHLAPAGAVTWRSALALGFTGGAVPSASAVIVLLVAISSDRVAFGSLLIGMFGIGMAVVLGGLGLVIARVGSAAGKAERGWLASAWVRRAGRWVPVVAGVVVLCTGVAFAVTAAAQLS
jgi:nickel/cobalt transporter (NicO) family protein